MSVESFLNFWSRHNTGIIEVLIGLILLTVVYLAVRTFWLRSAELESPAAAPQGADLGELEKTLKKLLENQQPSMAPGAGATAGVNPEEVQRLKQELADREKALEELKAQAAAAPAGVSDADKKALEDKIKDLEGRLAEYEIISEDIADLSFYKEENGKLQKELEALRGAAQSAPAAPEATAPAPTATASAPAAAGGDEIAKELSATMEGVPTPAAAKAEAPPAADLMSQFENFVKKS